MGRKTLRRLALLATFMLVLLIPQGMRALPAVTEFALSRSIAPAQTRFVFLPIVSSAYDSARVRFAVIGDYGSDSQAEADVAAMVKSWSPTYILTVGDNNYPDGAAATIDTNIGKYYHQFIAPYRGGYGAGARSNRFFPVLGNHDWAPPGAAPYLNYFTLPNNERYYDVIVGPVHLFALDSDDHEPDGNTATSTQGRWLQRKLNASRSCWDIVYMHHSPYSSGQHQGSSPWMQWPYQAWGADIVMSGHDHVYERIVLNRMPYFVNGLGGETLHPFGTPVQGSQVRYNRDYGAMLVDATKGQITFEFYSRARQLIDSYSLGKRCR